jgi:uncharacterized membrane protein YfhO
LNLAETTVVEGPAPSLETCAAEDAVHLTGYTANRVDVEARMGCRGMLILGDAWFPGWNVYVDGRQAPLLRTCSLVRGVVVESGSHRVTFRYQPWTVYLGAALALLGLAICGLVVFTPMGARLERWATERGEL